MTARIKLLPIICIIFLCGCSNMFPDRIGDVVQNPRKYCEKEVKVKGKVTQIFSMIVIKSFVIKDDTGEIRVITQKPMPRVNETVRVHGIVNCAFSLGDQQIMVIVEN